MTDYASLFPNLLFDTPATRVLRIKLNSPERKNAMNRGMHDDLLDAFATADRDPDVRSILLTGAGDAFCSGADTTRLGQAVEAAPGEQIFSMFRSARSLVRGFLDTRKPIVTAINGPAVGVGLAIALLADISIAGKNVRLIEGHLRLGVAAGDHAAMLWPLLCGMAKAKYFIMLQEPITGAEAERMNLISLAVEDSELEARSISVAERLAAGAPAALEWTKHTFNHWLRQAEPIFEASLALELAGFHTPDAVEGVAAINQRRPPMF